MKDDLTGTRAIVPDYWLSDIEIGEKIHELREGSKHSQAKLAGLIDRKGGQSDLSKWETGAVSVPRSALIDIARVYGVDVTYFQVAGPDRERQGMQVAARWMDKMADELRSRATSADGGHTAPRASKPEATGSQPQGPSALKSGFLTAIKGFSDLEVEQICGISHETVRKWRGDGWPARGPNRDSVAKIRVMIARHDVIIKENAVLSGEKLPAFALGLIEFAQDRKGVEDFCKKHPKLGWLSIADHLANAFRELDRMTICDEFMWIGYKHAHDFDPETASPVTLKDYDFNVPELIRAIEEKSD